MDKSVCTGAACDGAVQNMPEVLLASLVGAWRVEQLQADALVCMLEVQGADGRLQQQGLLVRLGVSTRTHLAVQGPQRVVCKQHSSE